MEFSILGALEIRVDGRAVEVSSAKERQVLAVLLVYANEVVSVDRLIEVLWGGQPPATAANTVQTYISHLRRALEPGRVPRNRDGVLRTRAQGYELAVEPEAIDAVRFERLARDGRQTLRSHPEQAAGTLRSALGLWRGEALAEFGFELFAQAETARLSELRLVALEDRVEADLVLGRHADLCAELSLAVTEQPLRERLWSQLIRSLYRCGRQAEALEAYARLREQLAELLGIDPSPELTRLHEAVLAQRPDLDWRPPPPQVRNPAPAVVRPAPQTLLGQAHDALAAHDWQRAFDLLSRADRSAPLNGDDLEGLAEAAYWLGRYREALPARQRAHQAHLKAGEHRRAAVDAVVLSIQHGGLLQFAVASGWLQRARRLLEAEPDCVEQGYLAWGAVLAALRADDHEQCLVAARSTYELGVRHHVPELQALGMVFQGAVLIRRGQAVAGLALHDEAMAMAVSGDLSQLATVQIFCQVIRTCYELGDFRRAREWTEAVEDCFVRTGLNSFPGDCETHRIAIMVSTGAWALAEQEAHRASALAHCFDPSHAGLAFAGIGDVRLRMGDLRTAEEAYARAEELGASPLPGRAQLELRRGRPAEASAMINAALAGDGWDRLARCRLLPCQVSTALAVGDVDTARAATAELTELAQCYTTKAMQAAAQCARGELALVTGGDDPVQPLRRSAVLWAEASAPYESARVRVLLADALNRAGQPEPARHELGAALACFERLGATLDIEAVTEYTVDTTAPAAVG